MKDLHELLAKFSIKPHNIELFELAFTHSSFNADSKTKHHDYERLEFLGDSVVGFVVAELAYKSHPEMSQGELTKLKSALVASHPLSELGRELGIYEYIRVGNSYNKDLITSDSLIEDVFEAFLGAIYLDQGYLVARKFLIEHMYGAIQSFKIDQLKDYKSKLQEEIQAEHRESVKYEVIRQDGPPHDRVFTVQVSFDGIVLGVGQGPTKKKAEQEAARVALEKRVN